MEMGGGRSFGRFPRWAGVLAVGLCGLGLCPAEAWSQLVAPQAPQLDDPARRLLEEERARQRDERLTRPAPEIATEAASEDDGRLPSEYAEEGPAFAVQKIVLNGNTLLEEEEIEAVTAPFRGVPLGANRIELLLRRLTGRYLEKGYFTTRVYLGAQNLGEGTLVVDVFEGRLEALHYRGGEAPLGVRLAFPVAPGEILRLQDLEQGVEQMNRLRRNHATITVSPGQRAGGSLVEIRNREGDASVYSFGLDNGGQKATGETRLRLGASFENILGAQESFGLHYTGTENTNALLLTSSLAVGYHSLSYTLSYSDYVTPVGGYALLYGDSLWHNLGWNMTLERGRAGRSGLDVSLSHRHGKRYLNETALTPQRLTSVRVAANRYRQHDWGAWIGEIAYSQGIGLFGADRDPGGLASEAAHARFRKLSASLDVSAPLGRDWHWRTALGAQWSRSGLYGAEQFFLGGMSTVRGFDESGVTGDRGILVRNDLAWNGQTPLARWGVRAVPYLFVDAGHARLLGDSGGDTLVGMGGGVRFGGRGASGEISVGWPVRKSGYAGEDGARLAFSLNYLY
jgi:hemolysin activation/secretion protein